MTTLQTTIGSPTGLVFSLCRTLAATPAAAAARSLRRRLHRTPRTPLMETAVVVVAVLLCMVSAVAQDSLVRSAALPELASTATIGTHSVCDKAVVDGDCDGT